MNGTILRKINDKNIIEFQEVSIRTDYHGCVAVHVMEFCKEDRKELGKIVRKIGKISTAKINEKHMKCFVISNDYFDLNIFSKFN
jgi:hypothetical protein